MSDYANAEAKIREKFQEMVEKRDFKDGATVTREFTLPNPLDSDEVIDISIKLSCRSAVPKTGSDRLNEAAKKIMGKTGELG